MSQEANGSMGVARHSAPSPSSLKCHVPFQPSGVFIFSAILDELSENGAREIMEIVCSELNRQVAIEINELYSAIRDFMTCFPQHGQVMESPK